MNNLQFSNVVRQYHAAAAAKTAAERKMEVLKDYIVDYMEENGQTEVISAGFKVSVRSVHTERIDGKKAREMMESAGLDIPTISSDTIRLTVK